MARSAARRLVTGALNVTTTGCATPTTSPGAGKTDAMAKADDPFRPAHVGWRRNHGRADHSHRKNAPNNRPHGSDPF